MPDGFGRLAWVYQGLEYLVFNDRLQRARLALLVELAQAQNILILGEGDGRFLLELLTNHKTCQVTVLEQSPRMLQRTRARITRHAPKAQGRVTLRQADALRYSLPTQHYDALVSHFFLDVFSASQMPGLIRGLAASLKPGGLWLLADFAPPQAVRAGAHRLLSRSLLLLMYAFFRVMTGLPARHLIPPQPFMVGTGLELSQRKTIFGGFLYAELWQKPEVRHDP